MISTDQKIREDHFRVGNNRRVFQLQFQRLLLLLLRKAAESADELSTGFPCRRARHPGREPKAPTTPSVPRHNKTAGNSQVGWRAIDAKGLLRD